MRIREPNSNVATCSECGAFFPKTLDKCKECGTPDQPKAYKVLDSESIIGKSKCELCGSITVSSLESCSNPTCNAIFIGSKKECPYCNELVDIDDKNCKCGFDFISYKKQKSLKKPDDLELERVNLNEPSKAISNENAAVESSTSETKNIESGNPIIAKKDELLPTRWLSFINYIFVPLIILATFYFFAILNAWNFNSIVVLFGGIPFAIILHKRNEIAFFSFKVFSIICPGMGVYERMIFKSNLIEITNQRFIGEFVIGYILYFSIFSIPNLIYINKRKSLFKNIIEVKKPIKKSKEETALVNQKASKNTAKAYNPFEAIEKLSKLKENGSITEKEFQKKKEELLNRV